MKHLDVSCYGIRSRMSSICHYSLCMLRRSSVAEKWPRSCYFHRFSTTDFSNGRKNVSQFRIMAGKRRPYTTKGVDQGKNYLKAKQSVKQFGIYSDECSTFLQKPVDGDFRLAENQAIGLVVAAQANFLRVIVKRSESAEILQDGVNNDAEGFDKAEDTEDLASDDAKEAMRLEHARIIRDERAGTELLCVVRALLKKVKMRAMVGDEVLVGKIDWGSKRGMIENVFERTSELSDPPVANVNHLLVLFSLDQPKPEAFNLTRFLVDAESTDIPFTLVFNKMDLVQVEVLREWRQRVRSWGYNPLFCSVDSYLGLTAIANVLKNETSVVVGPSGVGKSSLINALHRTFNIPGLSNINNLGGEMEGSTWFHEQRVGDISARSGRGKHTTRNVTLLPLPNGGYLTDTPGFNQPGLIKVTKNSLGHMFPEIRRMLESDGCAFNNCLHLGEPGCAVKGDWERYPFYLQLLDEIKVREEIQLRLVGTKREGEFRYKYNKKGVKQPEPRLDQKRYRRASRKTVNQQVIDDLDSELEDENIDMEDTEEDF